MRDVGRVVQGFDVLRSSLETLGIDEVDYQVRRAATGERSPRTEPDALEQLGFELVAVQRRLEHSGAAVASPEPSGVAIRTVADLGVGVLRDLIAAVAVGSGDRASHVQAADAYLADLLALYHEPAWWEVLIDEATGRPLGFVLPARVPEGTSTIGFIGVVPEARGRGLGRWLLARGTATLRRDPSALRVVADVDATNEAMLKVAAAVGYAPFASRAHYRWKRR